MQLLSKTNQFNTTTRRYRESDLSLLRNSGASIWPIGLSDRFCREKEIIALVIVRWPHPGGDRAEIDSLLLSCRVIGRSVETGILARVIREARQRGVHYVEGIVIPTKSNEPARDLFLAHGFRVLGDGRFEMDVMMSQLNMPDWFIVNEDELSAGYALKGSR